MSEVNNLESEWWYLLFGVRRSVRYHTRRRQFFDRFNMFTSSMSVIFGSSAMYALLQDSPQQAAIAAAIVTLFASFDLVIGTAKSSRLHSDLARDFIELEKAMVSTSVPSIKRLQEFTARRLDIEANEPPVLKVLDSICHNELIRAMGLDKKEMLKIAFYQRWFAQFVDINEHAITT